LDFRTLWHLLMEKFWMVLLTFVVVLLLTAAHLHRAPRIFAATATIQVEQQEQKVVKFEKVQQEDLRYLDVLKTIEQTLVSRPLLERVVQANNLGQVFAGADGSQAPKDQLISMLARMVDVRLRRGTRLIDITVASTNPQLCEKLANSIVREYMRYNFELQSQSSQVANEFLLEEANRLKLKLQESEQKLQAYKESTKSVSLEKDQDIVTARLKEISVKVNEAKANRTRLGVENAQVRNLGTNIAALLILPVVASDPTIANINMTLSKLENDFANLRQRYKERHPKYIQAQSQLNDWRQTLTNAVLKISQTVAAAYANAESAEQELEKALHEQETVSLGLNKQSIQYNVLAREVESDKALYESVLTRLKETSLTKDLQSDKVRIFQSAYLPTAPISPNVRKTVLLAVVGGLAGGILLVLLLNAVDNSLKTVDQTEAYLGVPVLAVVPQVPQMKSGKPVLVVAANSLSAAAEAFRSLRTSVSMLGKESSRKITLFTSALPEEGKTFCSVNFGTALAQQGFKTVVIDADLRRPNVEKSVFGSRTENKGVTDFLTGKATLDEALQPTSVEGLFVIGAGTRSPNPAELLAEGGFDDLLDQAALRFDRVVVDTAPIHAVSDALTILNRIQTVCLVLRAWKTPKRAIPRALALLKNAGAPVAGVVLNRMPRRKGLASYDPYYEYSYQDKYSKTGVYGN
jgi:succinoglycan biosynthesis transport protein ExoP